MTDIDTFTPEVLLRAEQTDGSVSGVEVHASPDFAGPPLHTHDFDETFYVLAGDLTFQFGETLLQVGRGGLAFAPRGVPHTLANLSGRPARYLLLCTPAGFERYFARAAARRQGAEPPAWAEAPIPDVTTVGPQLARPATVDRSDAPTAHGPLEVLLRGEETSGAVSVVESTMPAGSTGPPLHRHGFDETFYVIDGQLRFQVRDELITARAGELAFAPRDVAHTLANHSDQAARFLIAFTPTGFEREFARRAAARAGTPPPDWATQPIPEVTPLGPPIATDR
jgi:quercetin dioxygenase-like cupin family protein